MVDLPILNEFIKSARALGDSFSNVRLFTVQHLFRDTEEWLLGLRRLGLEIEFVVGIEYSAKDAVIRRLTSEGFKVLVPPFQEMGNTIKNLLHKSLMKCKTTNRKLLIAEVGGYAVPILHRQMGELSGYCIGAVEETKQGLWLVQRIDELSIPIFQVADTALKRLESAEVGEAVVAALEMVLRGRGLSLAGLFVSVLGFGWIGSSVAVALRNRRAVVSCCDIDPIRNIEAKLSGFEIASKRYLRNCDVVIGATGSASLTKKHMLSLKDGVYLVSASSKNVEMRLAELEDEVQRKKLVSPYIEEFTLKSGKRLNLVARGFPVNFILETSVSSKVMDLIFAEVFSCMRKLTMRQHKPGIYTIPIEDEEEIAKLWRKLYK